MLPRRWTLHGSVLVFESVGAPVGTFQLPERYRDWRAPFYAAFEDRLADAASFLDIGSGRRPCIPANDRSDELHYVGLDLSHSELQLAPPGSYDEMVTGDIARHNPHLCNRFDVAASWQVLEHVRPLGDALENVRSYLRPGGRFVAHLSGTFAVFGLLNRALPMSLGRKAMHRLLRRDPVTVFPAYYDRCWYSALMRLGSSWSRFEVSPRFGGATYLSFTRLGQRLYLGYEGWAMRTQRPNLATHYLIIADK